MATTTISKERNVRFSKKALAAFPPEVAERLQALKADYEFGTFTFSTVAEGHTFTAWEGERYTVMVADRASSVEMVSGDSLGASGVSHKIGERFTAPVGAFVFRISYYGKYWLEVFNVQPAVIEE